MKNSKGDRDQFDGLDMDRSTQLLRLGLAPMDRPVDDLIARLEESGGQEWLAALLGNPDLDQAVAGKSTLEGLTALKEEAKRRLPAAATREARIEGILAYFVAVAAALVQHDATITRSHPKSDLEAVFLDLAAACRGNPLEQMFEQAAGRVSGRGDMMERPGD